MVVEPLDTDTAIPDPVHRVAHPRSSPAFGAAPGIDLWLTPSMGLEEFCHTK